ncbi:hypothetical protein [Brevundimonas sp. NIBR11]|uniref:hypothetical protein n=1 Tax=Brevundimonas sp. NIBR11 TaxID=3015999 RepID=UPI0022F09B07|nr:hypothetical protein [Brevundimonas sp. NIBR11]WGM31873.1 hypothetical protein KKHFBJBL_02123 [Brevundimonas sp. NIBR11]
MKALAEIEALKVELEGACEALMSAAQTGLEMAADTPVDGEIVSLLFAEILGLCAFQDLAGQRLDRLAKQIAGSGADDRPDAHLLNGPANGDGLDQAAADALFDK